MWTIIYRCPFIPFCFILSNIPTHFRPCRQFQKLTTCWPCITGNFQYNWIWVLCYRYSTVQELTHQGLSMKRSAEILGRSHQPQGKLPLIVLQAAQHTGSTLSTPLWFDRRIANIRVGGPHRCSPEKIYIPASSYRE